MTLKELTYGPFPASPFYMYSHVYPDFSASRFAETSSH